MPETICIQWRDIPSQVTAKAGRRTAKVMLSDRFQQAIDRAAMRAGKGSSDAYLEDWRRVRAPCGDDLEAEAGRLAAEIESAWTDERLETVVKGKGIVGDVAGASQPGSASP